MELHDSKEKAANKSNSLIGSNSPHELPIISQGDNLLVDARLLHQNLNPNSRFYDWINYRISEYGFKAGEDYMLEKVQLNRKGQPKTNYHLTLDMAKELAMLERSETGRFYRRYFIQKEKELVSLKRQTLIVSPTALFAGLKPVKMNNRKLYPYRDILVRLGYSKNSSNSKKRIYPQHFINLGARLMITEEFARHLAAQKAVYDNRKAVKAMPPVLAIDFGNTSKLLK